MIGKYYSIYSVGSGIIAGYLENKGHDLGTVLGYLLKYNPVVLGFCSPVIYSKLYSKINPAGKKLHHNIDTIVEEKSIDDKIVSASFEYGARSVFETLAGYAIGKYLSHFF